DHDGVPDAIDPHPSVANPSDKSVLTENGTSNGISNGSGNVAQSQQDLRFSCNQDAHAPKDLQRLSRTQYENTLQDLMQHSVSAATATAVMQAAQPALSAFPDDAISKDAPFAVMDQSVSQAHADAFMNIGTSVAQALTSSANRVSELVGSCASAKSATASTMQSCISTFIDSFGKRALRHSLNADEKSFYLEVYAASGSAIDAQGLADVITVMLNAPDFIYRVEFGAGQADSSGTLFQLNDYEIATRLAYEFWQTAPDDDLLAAADRGELSTDDGYQKALDRVLADPRAGLGLEQFAREWLDLDDMRPLDALVGTPVFDAFAGANKPNANLKEEMIQDLTDSIAFHAFSDQGTLAEWLESPYSFARTQDLASIYGTSVWDGKSAPPRFPDGQRAGLITRAALLSTGTANSNPILKGVLIRERLLCDKLGPPPPNAAGKLPDLSGNKTERQAVEALTEVPGSNCAGCHATQINPLGYATEGFDALGRVRSKENVYDAQGHVTVSLAVDTSSVPHVWASDATPSNGASDLTALLTDSGKVEACFAREWMRYSEARTESEDTDGCGLETVRSTLANGQSMKEALRQFALLPQFRQRFVPAS
ncbi:MAG TPA: DUF1592 domain-containing protein, partial [Polyangiaceae bacterium]|nr:DUF1592 domain-containing protein [Polyangiaceae bacterium]